tara:strand:- start:225 stop:1298 length:1074 start_codon:yes stop_codon:yes gene_type:complete
MSLKCGIVGLPNVGKSTLFNALTNSSKALAENFPFCTIDPNIGVVPVPDKRLDQLAKISNSKKKINTNISFVDIAGLVKGASKGEGLGNKFLSHIREVDAIIHLLRCFDSEKIQNVNKSVDPIRDLEIIDTEMKLADLDSIQKRLDKKNKKNISDLEINILIEAQKIIDSGDKIEKLKEIFDHKDLKTSGLLCIKKRLYVCNVDEKSISKGNHYTEKFINQCGESNTIIISADIENQINQLEESEKKNYLEMINQKKTGLNILINKAYKTLNLQTFFTSGPEETRAWTINNNCKAPEAAGTIHSDFEKGFIRAETISFNDFVDYGGWLSAREKGKLRLEGKDYIVNDGDVLNFRFNT